MRLLYKNLERIVYTGFVRTALLLFFFFKLFCRVERIMADEAKDAKANSAQPEERQIQGAEKAGNDLIKKLFLSFWFP